MTPEEINKAIADCLGYKWGPKGDKWGPLVHPWIDPKGGRTPFIPDFFSDLNACAEMERTLRSKEDEEEYAMQISGLFPEEFCDLGGTHEWIWAIARLTAPQRCEAFLRTKGLWVEQPTLTTR